MKHSHARPMPLPGGPPPDDDPDHATPLPVEPDDGTMPPPALPEEEGPGWARPV